MAKILLVDDEASIIMVLKEVLEMQGHEIAAVNNGFQALQLLEEGLIPEILLVDLFMPEMNGRSLIEKIHKNPKWYFPIVLITGSVPDQNSFPSPGSYQDIICKPFDIFEVAAKVERLLNLS